MVVVGGRRLYGKIEQVGSTYVATTFVFLQFLPLFPVRSHVVLSEGDGANEVIHIKMNWKSVAVGYLRAWGIFATMCAFIPAIIAAGTGEVSSAFAGAGALLVTAGLTTAAFTWIGKLSTEAKARRLIYARFAGNPVDLGIFDEDIRGKIGKRLRDLLEQRAAEVMSASGYRKGAPVNAGYRVLSLDPSMRDKDYLEAALTLAHIEASLAVGPARAEAERIHDAIWRKLLAEHPDVLGIVKEAEVVQGSIVRRSLGYLPLLAALGVMGFMLARNHHVLPEKRGAVEKPHEYGFVPAELLR